MAADHPVRSLILTPLQAADLDAADLALETLSSMEWFSLRTFCNLLPEATSDVAKTLLTIIYRAHPT